jgi:DNA-binding PadR family transcriptional regulator
MKTKKDAGEPSAPGLARKPALSELPPGRLGIPKRNLQTRRALAPTTPDLVVLSLLAERPMHGYQANQELERREIRDWAAVSKPQVYYSLEKLEREGLLRKLETGEAGAGPERDTFETTDKGRAALAEALEREEWTTQRDHPAFLTWLALSWQARPGVFRKQLKKRRKFLLKELAREKKTLLSIYAEVGHKFHEAVWMVGLMMDQLRTEIRWNRQLERDLGRRARAVHSVFAEGLPK